MLELSERISLDYWENINLRVVLIKNVKAPISNNDAYNQSILEFRDTIKLYQQLEKVLKTGRSNLQDLQCHRYEWGH